MSLLSIVTCAVPDGKVPACGDAAGGGDEHAPIPTTISPVPSPEANRFHTTPRRVHLGTCVTSRTEKCSVVQARPMADRCARHAPNGHAPKRRAKCALRGKPATAASARMAIQVMRCPRAEPPQRSGPRPATRGCPGRTHVVVETELHWKPVRSNINLLGAVITAWSA